MPSSLVYCNTSNDILLKGTLAWKLTTYFFGPIRKLVFFKDFKYILSDESDILKVKLDKIKTSFSTISMQMLRLVTDFGEEEWA